VLLLLEFNMSAPPRLGVIPRASALASVPRDLAWSVRKLDTAPREIPHWAEVREFRDDLRMAWAKLLPLANLYKHFASRCQFPYG